VREAPRLGDAGAAAALAVAQQMSDIAATLQAICDRSAAICGVLPARAGSAAAARSVSSKAPQAASTATAAAADAASDGDDDDGALDAEASQPAPGREASNRSAKSLQKEGSSSPTAAAAAKESEAAAQLDTETTDVAENGALVAVTAVERSIAAVATAGVAGGAAAQAGGCEEEQEEEGEDRLLLQRWLAVCVQLCSTHSALRSAQLELPAKDPRYIEAVNEVRWCPSVGGVL